MSDTNGHQIAYPHLSPPQIPNHIPYILQHLKEMYDRIHADETYIHLSSNNNTASQEDNATNVASFKLAFTQALHTLIQYSVFAPARQDEWVHKFERMREIASPWPNYIYYTDLIQQTESAFMDVLEWIRTCEEGVSNNALEAHSTLYMTLFNIEIT